MLSFSLKCKGVLERHFHVALTPSGFISMYKYVVCL